MVLSSSTLPSPLIASCKSSGWGLRYVTREWWGGGLGRKIIFPTLPKLGSPGLHPTPFHQEKWDSGPRVMNPWGVGTPETLLVILNPS